MTPRIDEYYFHGFEVNDDPEWARAERMEYCDNDMTDKHGNGLMKSLRRFWGRMFR